MFNFGGITHVCECPVGHAPGYNYFLSGSVPASMLEWKPATSADIMAGRSQEVNGQRVAHHCRKWGTIEEILAVAKENDVHLCNSKTCACRRLF